jgi:drug/metabolite transporter (DMT)-like permease
MPSADATFQPPAAARRPLVFYHLMALVTITIWSFSFLFIIRINAFLTPIGVVVGRKDIFGVLVVGLLLWRRPPIRTLRAKQWAVIVALAFVGGPLYHLIFAWSAGQTAAGANRIDPGLLGLILATVPVHAGWLAWLCLGERLSATKIAALALGLGGVAAVLWGRFGSIELLPMDRLEGPIAATISAVAAGGIVTLTRAARKVYGPIDLVAVSGAITVLMCALLHPVADIGRVASMPAAGWFALLFLGICGSGLAFLTWATALSRLPAVTTATYLFLSSVLAALWGWLFDEHVVGAPFAVGATLVLAGLLIMAKGKTNGKA